MSEPHDLMDIPETADFFSVSERTIGNWVAQGVLPSVKLGARRYFLRSVLEALLRERCVAVPADDRQVAGIR